MKKVEILMATYNGESYIEEQIQSIKNQTYKNWILTIRDDNSKDKTVEIIKKYVSEDNRIKLVEDSKGNLGYTKNFEELLSLSTGEYLFFVDQDDIWENNKIEKCIQYLKEYQVVHHNAYVFFENKKLENKTITKKMEKSLLKNLLFPNYIGCCMALRKEFLDIILPFPKYFPSHDIWIGLIADLTKNIYYIDDFLIFYRRHQNNTSYLTQKSKNRLWTKIKYRYYYFIYPILRLLSRRK